ncbi:MAG: tetratricopeptide repeat protein, partial [Acidobacteria bacterium]|nr:tetratricopeptide repeat protein [Acidobacteriota bacterium]
KHGLLLYRETLHVPLMVKLPGGRRGGERVAAPAALVDVLPTVAEVVGAEVPPDLPGSSLLALGQKDAGERGERQLYSETYYGRLHYGWSELHSLTGERFHFIDSPNPELYDLVADPRETNNVLAQERRVYRAMEAELEALPLGFEEPSAVDAEEAAKLAALGYLSAPARSGSGERPDPKENLDVLEDIQRAVDLTAAGRLEETVEVLKDLQQRHPEVQDTYLLLAPALRGLGAYEEALAVGREGKRLLPTLAPLVALELARSHLALGQLSEAAAEAQAGAEANPAQSFELLARIALARRDLPGALQQVEKAFDTDPPPRLSALLLGAEIQMLQERWSDALGLLDLGRAQVEAGEANLPLSLESRRGECLARLGRYEEAEQAFRAELAAFPAHRQVYTQLAFLLAAQRRFDEIEPLLEDLVRAAPNPQSYSLAADTLERLGNTEAARRWRQRGG